MAIASPNTTWQVGLPRRRSSSSSAGKTAGKDTAAVKATWPAVFGIKKSLDDARELIESAFAELAGFGPRAEPLKTVARYLVERKH